VGSELKHASTGTEDQLRVWMSQRRKHALGKPFVRQHLRQLW
jgi:hypothetical protein